MIMHLKIDWHCQRWDPQTKLSKHLHCNSHHIMSKKKFWGKSAQKRKLYKAKGINIIGIQAGRCVLANPSRDCHPRCIRNRTKIARYQSEKNLLELSVFSLKIYVHFTIWKASSVLPWSCPRVEWRKLRPCPTNLRS
jgi:hypothetical protein